jgi:EAL domain-containing protein (putative c-di-GMP-specific phosphodiesterase class I)
MLSLGDWVLHSACAQIRRWHRKSGFDLPLVIELSDGQAVDPDLVGRVLRILDEDGLPPERLRLGIPVHLLHGPRPEPAEHLRVLADAGVHVVLSDFGGAATDLAYLEDLPVTAVRIGEQVTATQAQRTTSLLDRVLTDLVTVVHEAGGTVAVDGVDTAAQADWWRTAGADTALGARFTAW